MRRRGFLPFVSILLAGFIGLVSMVAFAAPQAGKVKWEANGPRVDEIIMPIVKDPEAQLIALERGETAVLPGLIRPADIDKLKANPNVEMTMDLGFHMFYLAFNMRREPLKDVAIRRAISHVVDRNNIIRTLFQGYVLPLDSYVPQSSPFYKKGVKTYQYNPEEAKKVLDKAGYTLDPKTKVRIDPKTRKPLREIKLFTPTYEVAPTSAEIGKMIAEACQAIGLPVKPEPMDFPVMLEKIDIFEFDMYVLAWGLNRTPDFLYDFFHSSQDVKAGYNTPGIRDPELDKALEDLKYAPDKASARKAADRAQDILAELAPYVPLYSRPYIDAFRKDLVTGFVPMLGYGAAQYNNKWTTLNIQRTAGKGGTIRWLLPEEPKTLNIATSNSAYELEVLGRTVDALIEVDPETMEDMPWLAKDWKVETWEPAPGKKGSKITWYLREGVKWQDGEPFTAEDVKFTIEYLRDNKVPLYLSRTQDIVKVETQGKYTVSVYFSTLSYWHLYDADLAFLSKHIWKDVKDYENFQPWLKPHPKVAGLTCVIGTGPFIFEKYVPGEYVKLRRNPNYWAEAPRTK